MPAKTTKKSVYVTVRQDGKKSRTVTVRGKSHAAVVRITCQTFDVTNRTEQR